ncbi:MAG: hypothetical protein V8R14_06165 [Clostridia bacterium]
MVLVDPGRQGAETADEYMDQRAVREMKECPSQHQDRRRQRLQAAEESEDHARGVDERKRSGVEIRSVQKNRPKCTKACARFRVCDVSVRYEKRARRRNESLCRMYGVEPERLAIIECTDVAGGLTEKAGM